MSSYGKTLVADKLIAKEINWKSFNPPITGAGADQTLASVLSEGNDANDQNIVNVADLECTKVETPLCEATTVESTDVNTTNVTCENMTVNTNLSVEDLTVNDELFHKSIKPKEGVVATIRTNEVDSEEVIVRDSLEANTAQVSLGATTMFGNLDMSTPAGDTYDIIDGGNITCKNTKTIQAGNIAATTNVTAGNEVTAETVTANGKLEARAAENGAHLPATTFYDTQPTPAIIASMLNGDLKCKTVTCDTDYASASPAVVISEIAGQGVVATSGLVQAGAVVRAPVIDVSATPDAPEITVGLDGEFTGSIRADNTGRCTFTNCDFRDTSNLFTSSTQETYEWTSCWTNAVTNFPPPTGWKPYPAPQIPPINLVVFDFDQDRNKGWRYFAPQSDSDCQIDPDDKMGLNEGEYIHALDNTEAWKYAFYGLTAPTTIPAHASQIVEFQFPVTQYGYGRIYMGLAYQPPPYTAFPLILLESFRLVMEHEGSALSTNPRLNGPITMRWYLQDLLPTNGTQWRLYPMVRTDDTETTEGRMLIKIGNGQPLNGCNPGDPPIFDPADTNSQQGQLIMRGYPVPLTHLSFPSPPGQIS